MKMKKINIVPVIALVLALAFTGCSKNDGPVTNKVAIDAVPAITTTLPQGSSQAIDLLNTAAFSGKIKVALYFEGAAPPQKVDIVVRKNGSVSNVKMFKANVSTFPTELSVTIAEIEALFGAPIALGDSYDFAPDIYLSSGKKYEAFPATGLGSGPGPGSLPGYSEFARISVICAYDPGIYEGDFEVVKDEWDDFAPGQTVTLTRVAANKFSFTTPAAVAPTPVPIVVTVNTNNNQLSVPKTSLGTRWAWTTAYTGAFIASTGAATASFVAPCDEMLTLSLQYSVDQGTFAGAFLLVLKKK